MERPPFFILARLNAILFLIFFLPFSIIAINWQKGSLMIITCASCLTKFNLDDSRIPSKGVKVRCSRCQHVFYVVPPAETKEEVMEGFQSFARYHEDLMVPGEEPTQAPRHEEGEKEPAPSQKGKEDLSAEPESLVTKTPEPSTPVVQPPEKKEDDFLLFEETPEEGTKKRGKGLP